MGHVEAERNLVLQHITDAVNHHPSRSGFMFSSPMVEPADPELAAHQRSIRPELLQTGKLFPDVGSCSEIHRPQQVVQTIVREIRIPVALEKRYTREAGFEQDILYLRNILFVSTIRTILILHLNHYDISAFRNLERGKFLTYPVQEKAHMVHIIRIESPEFYIFLFQQPPRKASHLPFRTYVRARTDNDIHSVFLRKTAEFRYVSIALKRELAFLLFVVIPEHIHTDSVHTQRFAHTDAVFPILSRDTRIVKFGSLHDERTAIENKLAVAYRELRFENLFYSVSA